MSPSSANASPITSDSVASTPELKPEKGSAHPLLLGQSRSQLTEWVQSQQQPAYRGQQLHDWIYQKGVRSLADISSFPKAWREAIADIPIGRSTLHFRKAAADGTVKYLLQLTDGLIIEAVGIPSGDRLTVCVSSQVGCPMACDFCATGKGGLLRSLEVHEIVDQVLTVQEDFQVRVSNIVFMGMGEPLLNFDNVLAAVRSMNEDIGIGKRSITISTVGIPGRIRKLASYQLQSTLAVSLHASNQAIRELLIPSARAYPLGALLAECRDYVQVTGRRITFEYIVLGNLNDQPEHAEELAYHLRGFQSHVNLIPYNPISDAEFQRPSDRQIRAFLNVLKENHVAASLRQSRGLDKDAACGQLRASQAKVGQAYEGS